MSSTATNSLKEAKTGLRRSLAKALHSLTAQQIATQGSETFGRPTSSLVHSHLCERVLLLLFEILTSDSHLYVFFFYFIKESMCKSESLHRKHMQGGD